MKKTIVAILIGIAFVGFIFFVSKNDNKSITEQNFNTQTSENQSSPQKASVEKIEVVHFHATQQCRSCKTVGEYALKTIKEKFSEDYANGKIVFFENKYW